MESVTELMEEGRKLVMSDERRSVSRRLGEVAYDSDERSVLDTVPDALATEISHPCTTSLACAWEEVGVEKGEMASVSILHLIYLNILMINRDIVKLCERDAVKACSETEDSVDAALDLEIRLELLSAERVLSLLILLRPVAEVP